MAIDSSNGVPNAPITADASGRVNLVWHQFFVNLWQRTGAGPGTVSSVLDYITSTVGAMLYRGTAGWTGLNPGVEHSALVMGAEVPDWELLDAANFKPQNQSRFLAGPSDSGGSVAFRTIASPDLDSLLGQYPGTPDATAADLGNIGQYIESEINSGSPVVLVSNVISDITSIDLTPGDWDVWGSIATTAGPTTGKGWISSVSVTDPGAPNKGAYAQWGAQIVSLPVGTIRIALGAATTLYLSTLQTFGGAVSAYGFIGARRRH